MDERIYKMDNAFGQGWQRIPRSSVGPCGGARSSSVQPGPDGLVRRPARIGGPPNHQKTNNYQLTTSNEKLPRGLTKIIFCPCRALYLIPPTHPLSV